MDASGDSGQLRKTESVGILPCRVCQEKHIGEVSGRDMAGRDPFEREREVLGAGRVLCAVLVLSHQAILRDYLEGKISSRFGSDQQRSAYRHETSTRQSVPEILPQQPAWSTLSAIHQAPAIQKDDNRVLGSGLIFLWGVDVEG